MKEAETKALEHERREQNKYKQKAQKQVLSTQSSYTKKG